MVVIRKFPKESGVKNRPWRSTADAWKLPVSASESLLFHEVSWPFLPRETSPWLTFTSDLFPHNWPFLTPHSSLSPHAASLISSHEKIWILVFYWASKFNFLYLTSLLLDQGLRSIYLPKFQHPSIMLPASQTLFSNSHLLHSFLNHYNFFKNV